MEKLTFSKKNIISISILTILGIFFVIFFIGMVGNQPQQYKEYAVEMLAIKNSNKSGELFLFWVLLFAGSALLIIINKILKNNSIQLTKESNLLMQNKWIIVLMVVNLFVFFMQGSFNSMLLCATALLVFFAMVAPEKAADGLVATIFTFYSAVGFTYLYNLFFDQNFNTDFLLAVTVIVVMVLAIISRKRDCIRKVILTLQLFMPLLLIVFLCNKYINNGETIYLNLSFKVYIIILTLIAALFVPAAINLKKRWNDTSSELSTFISVSACIALACFSIFSGTELFVPLDTHHPGEVIISYQQIFEMNQIPYVTYYPVSGLFAVFQGGILKALGGGLTYFGYSCVFLKMFFAGVIVFLCSRHINKLYCLLISAVFVLAADPMVDRANLVLISVLILLLPNLIKKKNLWLKIWVLLSLAGILYYPLYGVATFLGSLPFAVVQFLSFIKNGELQQVRRTFRFYIWWAAVLIPLVLCAPMLAGIIKHTLVYSSQTVLADGIAVFGQSVPDHFMPFLNILPGLRLGLYYSIRFLLPALFIWIFVLLLFKFLKKNKLKPDTLKTPQFFILTYGIIACIISFTYTVVREDPDMILSRTQYILFPMAGVLLILFCVKYMRDNLPRNFLIGFVITAAILCGPSVSNIQNIDSKLVYKYNVPQVNVLIPEEVAKKIPNIGNGFIDSGLLKNFEAYADHIARLRAFDNNLHFIGWDYMYLYGANVPTCGQPSIYAIKSYATTKETLDVIKKLKPVIFEKPTVFNEVNPFMQYYLYYWLMTTDEYVYSQEFEGFLPAALSKKIYGDNVPDKRTFPSVITETEKIPQALGRSMDTLASEYANTEIDLSLTGTTKDWEQLNGENSQATIQYIQSFQYKVNKPVAGKDADFLYILVDVNRQDKTGIQDPLLKYLSKDVTNDDLIVTVNWDNSFAPDAKNYIKCKCGQGVLLIPLGANVNWLMNDHSELTISVSGLAELDSVDISRIQLLKLKQKEIIE